MPAPGLACVSMRISTNGTSPWRRGYRRRREGLCETASSSRLLTAKQIARSPGQYSTTSLGQPASNFVARSATSSGTPWQHFSERTDSDHRDRGFGALDYPELNARFEVTEETSRFEIPTAVQGYQLLSDAEIPFGVAPGNHDYDAAWFETPSALHIGGLSNFTNVFGAESDFFRDEPWYISSFNQGTSSAQTFTGGNYLFLHLAFEMQPSDAVLEWAQSVIDENPGIPTIISTHDFLSAAGEREPFGALDLAAVDPDRHNSAEQVWEKFIRPNDQVFMVLSGHQPGQAMRIDENDAGHQVYQVLADFQNRGQVGLEAGQETGPNGNPGDVPCAVETQRQLGSRLRNHL